MAGVGVVRALALRLAGPFELLAFRRGGAVAGVEAVGHHSGAGTDDDGVWRSFSAEPGRRRIIYRQRRPGEPRPDDDAVQVERTAVVLQWAAARLSAGDWDRLAQLSARRGAAVRRYWGDRDLVQRSMYRRAELTGDDHTRIQDSRDAQHAAEQQMRRLVTDRLTADVPPAGQQMSLFGDA